MGGGGRVHRFPHPGASQNWALIAGGFGLATLAAKIDRTKAGANKTSETVSDIADRALRH
jgi:hypothetical protein